MILLAVLLINNCVYFKMVVGNDFFFTEVGFGQGQSQICQVYLHKSSEYFILLFCIQLQAFSLWPKNLKYLSLSILPVFCLSLSPQHKCMAQSDTETVQRQRSFHYKIRSQFIKPLYPVHGKMWLYLHSKHQCILLCRYACICNLHSNIELDIARILRSMHQVRGSLHLGASRALCIQRGPIGH